MLKSQSNIKDTQHNGFASIGLQIARFNNNGGKDTGGEILRMKYRISQKKDKTESNTIFYTWVRSFSIE